MNEKEFNLKRDKYELVITDVYKRIKQEQLEMIISFARFDYDEKEIKGMLKLIAKTDEWENDFLRIQEKRRTN